MAWSSAALTAAEIAAALADKPCLIAKNVVETVDASGAMWKQGGLWSAGADETATNYEAAYAYDRGHSYETKPATAQTTWYYLMKWAGGTEFDTCHILGHNFGTIGGLTVTLQIADDTAFSTNLQTIATWTPGSSTLRLGEMKLRHTGSAALRYTGVLYARLGITKGSTFTPEIGELWLGRRRQLLHRPNNPYNPDDRSWAGSEFDSMSGVRTRTVDHEGRARVSGTWDLADSTEIADVLLFRDDSGYLSKPFLYVDEPETAAHAAWLMFHQGSGFALPSPAPIARPFSLELEEQAPFLAGEA